MVLGAGTGAATSFGGSRGAGLLTTCWLTKVEPDVGVGGSSAGTSAAGVGAREPMLLMDGSSVTTSTLPRPRVGTTDRVVSCQRKKTLYYFFFAGTFHTQQYPTNSSKRCEYNSPKSDLNQRNFLFQWYKSFFLAISREIEKHETWILLLVIEFIVMWLSIRSYKMITKSL